MGDETRRSRLTKLLAILLISATCVVRAQTHQGDDEQRTIEEARLERERRDLDGVTTVLLVSARPGKSSPPLGILTKTARTFVQDGASTEYATQVLGTTLANGRLYARILSTSSRVFYENPSASPNPSDPYIVYPSRVPQTSDWQFGVALDNAVANARPSNDIKSFSSLVPEAGGDLEPALEFLERENDVFSGGEPTAPERQSGFKPAKVRPPDNLPTYTVKPPGGFDSVFDRPEESRFVPKDRIRRPKLFGSQGKNEPRKQFESKSGVEAPKAESSRPRNAKTLSPLNTVTYHGFADFTTTVGDTVIVFSPSTAPAPPGRPATTIKGDATLRPGDGIAVKEIHATSVMAGNVATMSGGVSVEGSGMEIQGGGMVHDPLLEAINGGSKNSVTLEPSVVSIADTETESSSTETTPLASLASSVSEVVPSPLSPTGLLSTVASTTSDHGTTTVYKSMIYGTYVGMDYAKVTHTASDVYFFPDDEATISFGIDEHREGSTTERVTMESNELTTAFEETTDNSLTTLMDDDEGENSVSSPAMVPEKDTTLPMPNPVTEPTIPNVPSKENDIPNDILPLGDPQGRSINGGGKNRVVDDKEKGVSSPSGIKLVPTTVLKTYTRLTTFFIPDEVNPDVTTTSVKSGQVVSSEVSYVPEFATMTLALPTTEKTTSGVTSPRVTSPAPTTTEAPKKEVEEEEQTTKQDEEIELIFKTLYTTYTYLTTFFHETASSVSSREVVETNIITQTVGPYYDVSADVAGLFGRDGEPATIAPTMVTEGTFATTMPMPTSTEENKSVEEDEQRDEEDPEESQTEDGNNDETTTMMRDEPEVLQAAPPPQQATPETVVPPKVTPSAVVKRTFYTTYTYFTSIFVDDETEIETRTMVVTNVVTDGIQPTATIELPTATSVTSATIEDETTPSPEVTSAETPTTVQMSEEPETKPESPPGAPPDVLAYLLAIQQQKSEQEALEAARRVQQELAGAEAAVTEPMRETSTTPQSTTRDSDEPTTNESQTSETSVPITTEAMEQQQSTTTPPEEGQVFETMVTDVVSSSSSGGGTLILGSASGTPSSKDEDSDSTSSTGSNIGSTNPREPEDQELSESNNNNHEIDPAPTLLLQTSYTTFTFFTTMYRGDSSSVVSRLETVTNVVTETIRPTASMDSASMLSTVLPVTYFTTFTYWTTYFKGGNTLTTSREETVSDVVYPGIEPTVVMSNVPIKTYGVLGNEILNNEIPPPVLTVVPVAATPSSESALANVPTIDDLAARIGTVARGAEEAKETTAKPDIQPSLATLYTTLTYFTTSYIGNSTVLHSRLETITSVGPVEPSSVVTEEIRATGRAIDGAVPGQAIDTGDKSAPRPTGLLSTIRTSQVNDGTTTHFVTDISGTFVDGLYARVVESSSSIEVGTTPASSSSLSAQPTPALPTGILSLDRGSVVDADKITTVYYTTRQIGTTVDGLYAKIVESESKTNIDEDRKAALAPTQSSGTHRTGLVRVIEGQIVANETTTFYKSKVIGTSIDGRYAQIIESTFSYAKATPTLGISPSSTVEAGIVTPTLTGTGNDAGQIHPSPAVVESSMPEDRPGTTTDQPSEAEENHEDEEHDERDENDNEGEDDDGGRPKKKSRLSFSSRKRTFTPVIRPFASRNRPTFNPKRKGGTQGATTITRTDITPTITATLASGKGNRFASSRGRLNSPSGPYSSSIYQPSSGSRRFSGRRFSSSATPALSSSSGYSSGRGRSSSRISPSSVGPGDRRGSSGYGPNSVGSGRSFATRNSANANNARNSAAIYGGPSGSSRFRPGIRSSSTLLRGQASVRNQEDQEENANDYSATTLVTEETPTSLYTDSDGAEGSTTPLQTTTESSRRSTNPLLRFRRPPGVGNGFSPRPVPRTTTTTSTTPSPRRNGNLANRPTGGLARGFSGGAGSRSNTPVSSRPRPGQSSNLFPPRGLFNNRRPEPVTEAPEPELEEESDDLGSSEDDGDFEDVDDETIDEITDNDYEGSERDETSSSANRRSGTVSPVRIRPFAAFGRNRRVRRQASQLRSLSSRFRKPAQPAQSEEKEEPRVEAETSAPTVRSRYGGRSRFSSASSSTAPKPTAETTSAAAKPRTRSKAASAKSYTPSSSPSPRVRPSPTSGSSNGRQFTLREKDSSSSGRASYRRTSATPTSRTFSGRSESSSRPRPPRLRGNTGRTAHSDSSSSSNSRRVPSNSRSRGVSRTGTANHNRRVPQRSRTGSNSREEDTFQGQVNNDGTITVTHYVPTEVTIPAIHNGITEYRNIITAAPSTEVLGPDRYSTVVGGDGRPLVVISSEVTGTNALGQLEVTRFLLHESSTTYVTHLPTNIGGRRTTTSRIVPSTVYSVENVVSTQQPTLPAANAPLANILLSQLLLGQLGQANPLLGGLQQPQIPQGTPTTQYNTRTTTYVTTITKQQSTVIPLTFRGKEILTTLVDSSTDVVTATEFITDTVIVTPTAALPAANPNLNSLLFLLQQPQQPQQLGLPQIPQVNAYDPLFAAAIPTRSNSLAGESERRNQPADLDYRPIRDSGETYEDGSADSSSWNSREDVDVEPERQASKPSRSRTHARRPSHKSGEDSKVPSPAVPAESSVITVYVSGRRPGEFTTILSTVRVGEEATKSRRKRDENVAYSLQASRVPFARSLNEVDAPLLFGSEEPIVAHAATQSLESVVGDVGRHISSTMARV